MRSAILELGVGGGSGCGFLLVFYSFCGVVLGLL